ncbi:hypothetical protein MMC14_006779 [Varicellaria rhodocarpa]|nr:hypothetical protein [Varicellaria rhodocarpa]
MLRALFPDTDNNIVEDLCFSKLHVAVLGLSPNSLEIDILEHEDQINEVDLSGNTPLTWAVQRADLKATKDLLKAGTDPDISGTGSSNSCLMHAAAGGNLAILKLLLEAGSSHFTSSDTNALHWAAETSRCADIIDVLITAGVDIEQRSYQGGTPLGQAVSFNNVIAMKSLLKFHPNVNVQDSDGDTPLLFACF